MHSISVPSCAKDLQWWFMTRYKCAYVVLYYEFKQMKLVLGSTNDWVTFAFTQYIQHMISSTNISLCMRQSKSNTMSVGHSMLRLS